MLLEIYRDQTLEKLLIVEHRQDIQALLAHKPDFLKGLELSREIDSDVEGLPMGLDKREVFKAIEARGYFAARLNVTVTEVAN